MKKLLALFLAIIMTFSLAVPAFAVGNQVTDCPTIYIRGAGRNLYESDDVESDETIIYPFDVDIDTILDEHLEGLLKVLAEGLLTGNYTNYCDYLYGIVAPIFEDIVLELDENNLPADGSGDGVKVETIPVSNKHSDFRLMDNDFRFDFRLSPLTIADDLKIYIDRVYAASGNKKVALVGRCFAGNVVSAYLQKYPEHAEQYVENVVMYISSTEGVDMMGALFAGEIQLDPNNVESILNYFLVNKELIEDPTISALVSTLVAVLNHATVLGLGTDAIQGIVDAVKDNLVPRLALATFATFPGYWAMVPAQYYEKAKNTVFAGQEEKYSRLIAINDKYYNEVQLTYAEVMKDLQAKGIAMNIIAKYNIPGIPVYAGAGNQSDLMSETKALSFGATVAPYGETLSQSYIDSLTDKRFLSPDLKIDASTCLFPETTWFFKDLSHYDFPDSVNQFIADLINSKGTINVFTENYPQFLHCDPETEVITPVVGTDPEKPEEGSDEERFTIFIRFFTAVINFITKLFKGELF